MGPKNLQRLLTRESFCRLKLSVPCVNTKMLTNTGLQNVATHSVSLICNISPTFTLQRRLSQHLFAIRGNYLQ